MKLAATVITAFLAVQIYASPLPEGDDPTDVVQGFAKVSEAKVKTVQTAEVQTTADAAGADPSTAAGGAADGSEASQVLKEAAAKAIGLIQKGLATGDWSKTFDFKLAIDTFTEIFENLIQLVVKDGMTKLLKASLSGLPGPKSSKHALAASHSKTTVKKYETKTSQVTAHGANAPGANAPGANAPGANANGANAPVATSSENTPTEAHDTKTPSKDPRVLRKGPRIFRGQNPAQGAGYGLNDISNSHTEERLYGVHG